MYHINSEKDLVFIEKVMGQQPPSEIGAPLHTEPSAAHIIRI